MASPHPMTALSAAQVIGQWVQTHGHMPVQRECVPANGLIHWWTVYKLFPGSCFSGRISAALSILGLSVQEPHICLGPDCQVVFLAAPEVRLCPRCAARLEKPRCCLGPGCDAVFVTTPEVRLCPRCRDKAGHQDSFEAAEGRLSRVELRRYGVGISDWEEIMEWR